MHANIQRRLSRQISVRRNSKFDVQGWSTSSFPQNRRAGRPLCGAGGAFSSLHERSGLCPDQYVRE
jgi:hypothetical protein